ncbi:unnamed protein product [Medioppia subpectinata]|uniref:RCC1-like domain-containing protein n=1 Tax=Medioppia subpectinata TaxID=1979941 RepID=A0A7R9PTJ2_9ACAR|nr:unnamed protein product [Medioppia subpectinata]CAG2100699.1 unnamed protein product [Medioppia subpectinata]
MSFNLNNEKIVDIECGFNHTLALTDAGHVYTWGYNNNDDMSNLNTTNHSTLIQVMGGLKGCHVTSIACGYNSLAVTDTGSVFLWVLVSHDNGHGELGLSDTTGRSLPVQYFKDMKVAKVSAGTGDKSNRNDLFKVNIVDHGPIVDVVSHMNSNISAAVTANGVLYLWGECREPIGDLLTPIAKSVIKISSGWKHLCALTSSGDVYVWGDNSISQLGNGNTTSSPIPLKMSFNLNNEKIVDIECGLHNTLALTDAGHVYAWGYNNKSQLGNGNTINQSTPIQVMGVLNGCRVTSIACGRYHSLAVTDTGSVFGWGYNGNGELGLSTTTDQSLPVQIQYFKDMKVVKVCAGMYHTIILLSDGSVCTFGFNNHGQLGTGDKTTKSDPFKVNINHHGPIVS